MSGSTSGYTSRAPACVARAAGGGTGIVHGSGMPRAACWPGHSETPVPVLPPQYQGTIMAGEWPLQGFIELGPLPGAVPCARLHTRQLLWEWGLAALSESAELLVSELVTNAVKASRSSGRITPVRLWLRADKTQVLILVGDSSLLAPAPRDRSGDEENGRGYCWWRPSAIAGAGTFRATGRSSGRSCRIYCIRCNIPQCLKSPRISWMAELKDHDHIARRAGTGP